MEHLQVRHIRALISLVGALALGCGEEAPAPTTAIEEPETTSPEDVQIPEETASMLEALGYAERAPTDNPEEQGVTTRGDDAADGLNLFSSRDRAVALLTDLEGEVVHTWQTTGAGRAWMHVEPLQDGSLLAITKDRDLALHAWDSSVLWRTRLRAHHDLARRADGSMLVLVRGPGTMDIAGHSTVVLTDEVVEVGADGEVGAHHPLLPLFAEDVSAYRRGRITAMHAAEGRRAVLRPGGIGDALHTNSIAVLEEDIEGIAPAGSILLSFRATSRIAIVDADFEEVLFRWGRGELEGQHDATPLEGGNLLMFDNGNRRSASRAIELDPRSGTIVWSYEAEGLYSQLRGGAQRLSTGNVLITEADSGHAIEVSREGEVVWEFWNPDVRTGESGAPERANLYRLNRFPRSFFAPLGESSEREHPPRSDRQGQMAATPGSSDG